MYHFKVNGDCDISEAYTTGTLTVAQIMQWHQYTVPRANKCNIFFWFHFYRCVCVCVCVYIYIYMLLFNFVNYVILLLRLCILVVMFRYFYYYVCSVSCILFHCVVLCIVGV
jgi:hypothetical protein